MVSMYIYNLYDKMIKDLKLDGDLKDKYTLANKKMLDSLLDYVNYMINKKVLESYNREFVKDKNKMFNYFVNAKLKNLMENIQDF